MQSHMPDPREDLKHVELLALIARLEKLASSFPSLRNAPGVKPWNEEQFETWIHEQSKGAYDAWWDEGQKQPAWAGHAGWFILSLVDNNSGMFDLVLAMATWDEAHRDAFRAWAADPFSITPDDLDDDRSEN